MTRSIKLIGITVNDELTCDKHVEGQCQKVCTKVIAISRVASHMDEKKGKILYQARRNRGAGGMQHPNFLLMYDVKIETFDPIRKWISFFSVKVHSP